MGKVLAQVFQQPYGEACRSTDIGQEFVITCATEGEGGYVFTPLCLFVT